MTLSLKVLSKNCFLVSNLSSHNCLERRFFFETRNLATAAVKLRVHLQFCSVHGENQRHATSSLLINAVTNDVLQKPQSHRLSSTVSCKFSNAVSANKLIREAFQITT